MRDNAEALAIFGNHDEHLRLIEASLPVRLLPRGNEVRVQGEAAVVEQVAALLQELAAVHRAGSPVTEQEVAYAIRLLAETGRVQLAEMLSDVVTTTVRGRPIKPKTLGQKQYIDMMRKHSLVFGIGPAGTGKTYLAIAVAVAMFRQKQVQRIILTRPAVEAGEKLGFLPGDLQEKVNPYLRPLYDALFDVLGVEMFEKYRERGIIEVAPLAYMRGRTLDDSFIILDEAQNTTPEQMKMFLTRLGFGSRAVVTGDVTQVDLPRGTESGLDDARRVLEGVPGIGFVHLSRHDVVRHELVQRIIAAYEAAQGQAGPARGNAGAAQETAGERG